MTDSCDDDDEVGYKKPPKRTQFKKGQSGNPYGRPKKKPKTPLECIEQELQKEIVVVENGRQRKMRIIEVISKNLVNSAAKGDLKAIARLFKEVPMF